MKTILKISLLGFISFNVFVARSSAEGPCAGDIQKFCADVKPGGGAIAQCLKAHEAQLSEGCKARGEELKSKMKSFVEVCQDDLDKYCKDAPAGKGRKIKCLKDNLASLSPDCKTAVSQIRGGAQIHPAGN
jgi:hypothetical protein